jgi:hypothetical protein
MVIIGTGGGKKNVGEMICYWDEGPALQAIRNEVEGAIRHFLKIFDGVVSAAEMPTDREIEMGANPWLVKAEEMFEEYAPRILYQAQVRLVMEVKHKLIKEVVREITGVIAPDHEIDLSKLDDAQKEIFRALKNWHNRAMGIHPGVKADTQRFDRSEELARIKGAIRTLWSEGKSEDEITQKAVAEQLNLGSPETGANTLRKRLRTCGVNTRWRRFVSEVLSEPEINSAII